MHDNVSLLGRLCKLTLTMSKGGDLHPVLCVGCGPAMVCEGRWEKVWEKQSGAKAFEGCCVLWRSLPPVFLLTLCQRGSFDLAHEYIAHTGSKHCCLLAHQHLYFLPGL